MTREYHEGYQQGYKDAKEEGKEPTTTNDLGVEKIVDVLGSYTDLDIPYKREIAENILTKLPSVTPQESILDKIRAEIEQAIWEDVIDIDGTDEIRIPLLNPDKVFEIIDKYKAETEGT